MLNIICNKNYEYRNSNDMLILYNKKIASVSQDINIFFSLDGKMNPIIAVAVMMITKNTEIKLISEASFKRYSLE